jgi:hypothetical protein
MPRWRALMKVPGRGARTTRLLQWLEFELGNVLLDQGRGTERTGWPVIVTHRVPRVWASNGVCRQPALQMILGKMVELRDDRPVESSVQGFR